MQKFNFKKGFTLLEILLVVAAIGILASIVIIAINPGKQLAETRNAKRYSDVRTILEAVHQYSIDHGELPSTTIPETSNCETTNSAEVCASSTSNCSGFANLNSLTDNEVYLVEIPVDPSDVTDAGGAGYHIIKTSNDRITVCAPHAERDAEISVSQ
jgi:prepilin-type N-terminal cleavage/methylation domain-containing protein